MSVRPNFMVLLNGYPIYQAYREDISQHDKDYWVGLFQAEYALIIKRVLRFFALKELHHFIDVEVALSEENVMTHIEEEIVKYSVGIDYTFNRQQLISFAELLEKQFK